MPTKPWQSLAGSPRPCHFRCETPRAAEPGQHPVNDIGGESLPKNKFNFDLNECWTRFKPRDERGLSVLWCSVLWVRFCHEQCSQFCHIPKNPALPPFAKLSRDTWPHSPFRERIQFRIFMNCLVGPNCCLWSGLIRSLMLSCL